MLLSEPGIHITCLHHTESPRTVLCYTLKSVNVVTKVETTKKDMCNCVIKLTGGNKYHFPKTVRLHSYLSSPPYTFPYTEVDEHPGDSQRYGQWQAHLPWLLQSVSHLMHVPSSRADIHSHYRMQKDWTQFWDVLIPLWHKASACPGFLKGYMDMLCYLHQIHCTLSITGFFCRLIIFWWITFRGQACYFQTTYRGKTLTSSGNLKNILYP